MKRSGVLRWLTSPGVWLLLAAVALILDPAESLARVGGGDSYGGGGGGGGSGGGGDEVLILLLFEIARFLIILTIEHPAIGIPLDIIFVVVVIVVLRKRARRLGAPDHIAPVPRHPARNNAVRRAATVAASIQRMRQEDPNFSHPLFLDFVQLLYARAHVGRGQGDMESLAPYLSRKVRQQLRSLPGPGELTAVEGVVIGASRIVELRGWGGSHRNVVVEFEANYREVRGATSTLYAHERWVFQRKAGVLSKGPDGIADLRCPSCGAASELTPDGVCPYCRNVVDRGDFHWTVAATQVLQRRARTASEVHTGGGAEIGTQLPSVIQPGLAAAVRALKARDSHFAFGAFEEHVRHVFTELQQAWTGMEWERARAYETEHLYTTHRYWMGQFRADGRRNVLEQIRIDGVELVKVEPDAFFDSITVRIRASMIDYTVDRDGRVISGSRKSPRAFTEYWTFIRRAGVQTDPEHDVEACPSCGAQVKVSQSGVCDYCGTKVVTGEFGWVLSSIEQDEVYGG